MSANNQILDAPLTNPNFNLSSKEKFVKRSHIVGRFIAIIAVLTVSIGVGLAVPIFLQNWISNLPAAGIALGAAALLAVLKGLVESVPMAWEFIEKGSREVLPRLFAQIAVAALGLGFAYFAATPSDRSERSLSLNVTGSLPPVVMNEADSLLTAHIVFDEWKSELKSDDPQKDLIDNLVDSLAACIHSPKDRVELTVRGYASSFGTDAANEKLFKDRTDFVADLLVGRIGRSHPSKREQFSVDRSYWRSLQIMKVRRLFNDVDDQGKYQQTAGALNRRAEIRVRSAGSCAP